MASLLVPLAVVVVAHHVHIVLKEMRELDGFYVDGFRVFLVIFQ